MSDLKIGQGTPIILGNVVKAQTTRAELPQISEGADVVELKFSNASDSGAKKLDKRSEHFIKAGEHWSGSLKLQLTGLGLVAGAALATSLAPSLVMPALAAAGAVGIYNGLAHGIPFLYHMLSGFFSEKKAA